MVFRCLIHSFYLLFLAHRKKDPTGKTMPFLCLNFDYMNCVSKKATKQNLWAVCYPSLN